MYVNLMSFQGLTSRRPGRSLVSVGTVHPDRSFSSEKILFAQHSCVLREGWGMDRDTVWNVRANFITSGPFRRVLQAESCPTALVDVPEWVASYSFFLPRKVLLFKSIKKNSCRRFRPDCYDWWLHGYVPWFPWVPKYWQKHWQSTCGKRKAAYANKVNGGGFESYLVALVSP